MTNLFRSERSRILSNYARMAGGLLIGLLITRMLIGIGEEVFGVYVLVTVGMGISIMLTELLNLGIVSILGSNTAHGRVIEEEQFRDNLSAAFLISIVASIIGLFCMALLGHFMIGTLDSQEMTDAANLFLIFMIIRMLFAVSLAPALAVLLVSRRQVVYNGYLLIDRLAELCAIVIPLIVLTDQNSQAERLVQIGIGIAVLSGATYVAAAVHVFGRDTRFRPNLAWASRESAKRLVKRIGWNSLQVLSSNLYIRSDVLIVAAFLGPEAIVAFGVAIRLMGYLRQAANGLVTGLDATIANLHGEERRLGRETREAPRAPLHLITISTALQGMVVFFMGILLVLLADDLIRLWLGDVLTSDDGDQIAKQIATLSILLVFGIGFRSLNLAWMQAMTGMGLAHRYTPWMMPGAVANLTVLMIWGLFFRESFSVAVVGVTFLSFQAITHGIIIPVVAARALDCRLKELLRPLIAPSIFASGTYILAKAASPAFQSWDENSAFLATLVIIAAGFAVCLVHLLRSSDLKGS